jgi:hypothetical protein
VTPSIVEDAGEVAVARGLGYEAMTLRPRDATVRFVADGVEVVLTFDELAREAEQARAARQAAGRPVPHPTLVFEYPSPLPGGKR